MRCVQESNLDGLRKRISTLFLEYIKTPLFNPEAARLLKVNEVFYTLSAFRSKLEFHLFKIPTMTHHTPLNAS